MNITKKTIQKEMFETTYKGKVFTAASEKALLNLVEKYKENNEVVPQTITLNFPLFITEKTKRHILDIDYLVDHVHDAVKTFNNNVSVSHDIVENYDGSKFLIAFWLGKVAPPVVKQQLNLAKQKFKKEDGDDEE